MSIGLIVVIGLLTYGSRALALVLMPDPPARMKAFLDRIPAPLFAALAATSLIEGGALVAPPTLTAALLALAASPTRSLLWILVAGVLGYACGSLLFV